MSAQISLSRVCLFCHFNITYARLASSIRRRNIGSLSRAPLLRLKPTRQESSARMVVLQSRGSTKKSGSTDSAEQIECSSMSNDDVTPEEVASEVESENSKKKEPLTAAEKFLTQIGYEYSEDSNFEETTTLSLAFDRKMFNNYGRPLDPADEHFQGNESVRLPSINLVRPVLSGPSISSLPPELRNVASKFYFPAATHRIQDLDASLCGQRVVVHGFIISSRIMNPYMGFIDLIDFHDNLQRRVQLVSILGPDSTEDVLARQKEWLSSPCFLPVTVEGKVALKKNPKRHPDPGAILDVDIVVKGIFPLNSVSKDLIYTRETVYPPTKRHLQLRTNYTLYNSLRIRAKVASICRNYLEEKGFLEVETPLLFKSTPEGAREFLVPARSKGNGGGICYALPQSPQQYKQILMASGVAKYYQLARCFRDEDLRADRQPEFTQLDLEMSFATSEDVMMVIEDLVKRIWRGTLGMTFKPFKTMTYKEAMRKFGTDKPDLRFSRWRITPLNLYLPHHVKPNVFYEGMLFWLEDQSVDQIRRKEFLDSFIAEFQGKGDNEFISYLADDSEVLNKGLPAHGFTPNDISEINERLRAQPGCFVLIHKRIGEPFGSSTRLGFLRNAIISKACSERLIHKSEAHHFLWITEFPLFTPTSTDASSPGQSGSAGLSSTHHPFTAPLPADIHLLSSAPEKVRAAHFDLVANGVELGGGSRRIHDAALQKYVLESVIKVPEKKIRQFDHLLSVLDSGCPPHAGMALGFDRLIAVLRGVETIRDVIAFPKNSKGADMMVGSPSLVDDEVLREYHLQKVWGLKGGEVEVE